MASSGSALADPENIIIEATLFRELQKLQGGSWHVSWSA
jgi:hypothetical protein